MTNTQQVLIHRLNVCGRTVRHFGFGTLELKLGKGGVLNGICIAKGCHTVKEFRTVEELERFTDGLILTDENARMHDPVLRCRKANVLLGSVARVMKHAYYDVPSRASMTR